MSDPTDSELLRSFCEKRSEEAFAQLLRRHLDFVYSAACRILGNPSLAEDVAQAVFASLANNAAKLQNHPFLTGWLHRATRNIASQTIRDEIRRRLREQKAYAMNELLSSGSDTDWEQVAPQLDAALDDLNAPDREALLLRYFKNQTAREMALKLGISDEAAQKRVARALERLRKLLRKRGVQAGVAGLATLIPAHALQAAPAALSATISSTIIACLPQAAANLPLALVATKSIAMNTIQKTVATVIIASAVTTGIYQRLQVSNLRNDIKTLKSEQSPLAAEVARLRDEQSAAARQLAGLREDNLRLQRNSSELLKLRDEVGRLRAGAKELAQLKEGKSGDPLVSQAISWNQRVNLLKDKFEEDAAARIPELQLATEKDWLDAARNELGTETDIRKAMSNLRRAAEAKVANPMEAALKAYMRANNEEFPTDITQLQEFFDPPIDPAILRQYSILPEKQVPGLNMGGEWIISKTSPVDKDFDMRLGLGPSGWGFAGHESWNARSVDMINTLQPVWAAYSSANQGRSATDFQDLGPYLKTPEQKAAFQGILDLQKAAHSKPE
jgi:RNA polymerase sigma factor (sigma-70 family)